jgi:hypothetical protein
VDLDREAAAAWKSKALPADDYLANHRVLIAGGVDATTNPTASVELHVY